MEQVYCDKLEKPLEGREMATLVKDIDDSESKDVSTDQYSDNQWEPATQEDLDTGEWEIDY